MSCLTICSAQNLLPIGVHKIPHQESSQPKIEILVLWHANGMTTEISLHTKPRVIFSDDKVLIQGSDVSFEYSTKDVLKFTYKKKDIIDEINNPKNPASFTHDDEQIVFNGIKSSDEVALYKLNGSRVDIQLHNENGNYVLPLNSVPKGMYLLHINDKTFKIIKK